MQANSSSPTNRKIRVLVVDDEPWARNRIISLLKKEADFELAGECGDGESAVSAILSLSPEAVFLDVQMPGMNGFDVLSALTPEHWPQVIFVTAYEEYAVQAFEIHAADYLLKPFGEQRFRNCLDRLRSETASSAAAGKQAVEELLRALAPKQYLRRIGVKEEGRVVFLKTAEIDWYEATGNYITLHAGKESYLIRESMNRLESKLDPDQFVRIHRSTIVNIERVKELQAWFHGEQALLLKDGTRLPVGRLYRTRLKIL